MLWCFSTYWLVTGLAYMLSYLASGPAKQYSRHCGLGAELRLFNVSDSDGRHVYGEDMELCTVARWSQVARGTWGGVGCG